MKTELEYSREELAESEKYIGVLERAIAIDPSPSLSAILKTMKKRRDTIKRKLKESDER